MIPFIGIFIFSGFKWQIYNDQFEAVDNYTENALYSNVKIDSLRKYKENIFDENLPLQLLKYFVVENENKLQSTISFEKSDLNAFKIKTKNEND